MIGTLEHLVDIINELALSNNPQMKKKIRKIGLLLAKIWSRSFWIGPGGSLHPQKEVQGRENLNPLIFQ